MPVPRIPRASQSFRIVDTFTPTPTADATDLRFFPRGSQPESFQSQRKPAATTSRNMKMAVTIVGPGAGIHSNQKAWAALDQNPKLYMQVYGQSRGMYDRYPLGWPGGSPAPNLESLAEEMAASGVVETSQCLVLGSRGGQIVLPHLWSRFGDAIPPSIVINGGCALETPRQFVWPNDAVTLLVMGGQDYFRKPELTVEQYMKEARERVPKTNRFTAQLVVPDMGHIPEPFVLEAVLSHRVFAALKSWPFSASQFISTFQNILLELRGHGIKASLMYTAAPGRWMTLQLPQRPAAAPAPAPAAPAAPRVQQGTSTVAPASQSLRYRPHPSTTSAPPAPLYREVSERSPLQKARTMEFSRDQSFVPPLRYGAGPSYQPAFSKSLLLPVRSVVSVR
mgnify:CR=1 FL=1